MKSLDDVKRLFDISEYQRDKYDLPVALAHRIHGPWESISSREYVERIDRAACALLAAGVEKGDRVGLISSDRMEWCILDQAITKTGAITVPVYPTVSQDDFRYIFGHSAMRICFVSGKNIYAKVGAIRDELPALQGVYTLDRVADDVPCLEDFLETGDDPALRERLRAASQAVGEDDVATLIYTSGTTGTPKGV